MSSFNSPQVFQNALNIGEAKVEIVNRLRIHTEMVARLMASPTEMPLDFGTFIEEVGNAYMEIAEQINHKLFTLKTMQPIGK